MVDEKNYDVNKITDDIIDFFIEEKNKPEEDRMSNFLLTRELEERLESAGVFTIEGKDDMDEDDLEDLQEDITQHIIDKVLPNLAVKEKKAPKMEIKNVAEELFRQLTMNNKGKIPLKDGRDLTPNMLISAGFNPEKIDTEELVFKVKRRKRFDLQQAQMELDRLENLGLRGQSKNFYDNFVKVLNVLQEEDKKRSFEDDDIYFEFIDIPLENLFSNKTMGNINQRKATYKYWNKVRMKSNELVKELAELEKLLLGKNTLEQLKKASKEANAPTQMKNIVEFLETMKSIREQKVYQKNKVNFQAELFNIKGKGGDGNVEIKYNKLNYVAVVEHADIRVDQINKRAGLFVERFLENQGFMNRITDSSSAKFFAEKIRDSLTGQQKDLSSIEEVDEETFEAYDKVEEGFDEMRLDPLGILYLDKDLNGLAELYNDKKGTLLLKVREQFRKYKKVLALEPDDFERLKSKLEETIQGIKQVDGRYTYLPIFMFNEMPLKNYYREVGSLASQIEENINDVLTAYRDLIQEEKTFSAQNIFLLLFGTGAGKQAENIKPQERYLRRTATRVGSKQIRDFSNDIKKQIDKINSLMLEVFVKPMHSIHRSGIDLPFKNSTQLRTITVLSENVGDEYLAYKIMSENLKEFDYTFIDNTQVTDIRIFLEAINRGELFDDPNNKTLRRKAINFRNAVVKAYGKNKTMKERINKEVASIFGAVAVISGKDDINDFAGNKVKEAYSEERIDDPAEIGALAVLVDALKEKKNTLTTDRSGDREKGGLINPSNLEGLFNELDRIAKSDIYSRILEAHDSLRILKGKPIYYATRNENNFDHVEDMLIKIQTHHNLDMTANELVSIVNEIDSFDNISKAYGISNEHVYLIKANFR